MVQEYDKKMTLDEVLELKLGDKFICLSNDTQGLRPNQEYEVIGVIPQTEVFTDPEGIGPDIPIYSVVLQVKDREGNQFSLESRELTRL